ncbi:DUF4197 domain-containing protein [Pseudomonas sp. 21LCFQ02]|uniref:DUF4197 domain-containing protein n=1 Tax=unclassified Pseudomonas TaxID=196821 RepID=UPI0004F86214|nr:MULTISPECIES: DUF4197 domain-containing protein [unclassified Pseudomonas]MCO8163325.1 DUF4197 domain-containing protein [Pseudomonas sp. 21LCFQ010]MCO8166340.1 DUF4197 domain-containing protein [Pseudomonas sp. 21LCFQ02]MCQ9422641.1 DUF4197 domain-containing protein [Pseudomonas sp. LJDD11]BAP43838.1 putative uncharacterized protein [Pseudomonas sp. StFLB209]
MFRPSFTFAGLCAGLLLSANVFALSLSDLSQSDASGGLKDALTQGAQIAVKQLGTPGGFSNNQDVRIELPGNLGKVAKKMRQFGMGAEVDQLETSMNQAAEAAVPQAQALLVDAVKKMTVADAKAILSGGQDSATQYLDKTSREAIRAKFLPIVKQATDKVGVAQKYNAFAGQAAALGVLDAKNANVENYVAEQALNGLFEMIAKQEQSIRANPAAAATSLAKKVFGAL